MQSTRHRLRIASLNLAGSLDFGSRFDSVCEWLQEVGPDIVILQEVCIDDEQHNQAMMINDALANKFPYIQSAITRYFHTTTSGAKGVKEGLAVLSRYEITTTEAVALEKHSDDKHYRIIQLIQMQLNKEHRLHLANVHFSNNYHADDQLRQTLEYVGVNGRDWIIGGDFNIFDIKALADSFKHAYQTSVDNYDYVSYPSEQVTLDYFLLSKKYAIVDVDTKVGLSDHAGIVITIDI